MLRPKPLIAFLVLLALALFLARKAWFALDATLPPDMPRTSRFVQTGWNIERNEPTGYWVACHLDSQKLSDWCRVTDQHGMVIFEGQFLPADAPTPASDSDLVIGKLDAHRLWTGGVVEQAPVPVIPLANGRVLVPEDDRDALLDRWAHNPEESHKYLQASN